MTLRNLICKFLGVKLEDRAYDKLEQFAKFCLVGVINNLVYYICYILLIKVGLHYTLANIIGFTISVFNAFFWNNRYVFVSEGGRVWWKTFLKTYISYFSTGIVLSNILLVLWIEICNIPETIAPLIDVILTVPVNYFINKYWAFKQEKNYKK